MQRHSTLDIRQREARTRHPSLVTPHSAFPVQHSALCIVHSALCIAFAALLAANAGENGRLYVYSTDNPALLSHDIRVAVRENGVKLHSHTVVSDLAVRAVGAHGIFAGWRATPTIDIRISDCVFENCSFTGNRTINVGGGWGALTRPNRQCATPLLVYYTETDTVDIDVSGNTFENAPRGLIFKRGGIDTLPPGYRIHDNTVR